MLSKKMVLTGIFVAMAITSLLASSCVAYLLFASYNVACGIDASILDVDLAGSTKSANVTILVKNRTTYPLRLAYAKVVMYIDDGELENYVALYDNPIALKPLFNATVSILAEAPPGTLVPSSPRYGFALIYLVIYDVPIVETGYFTRRASYVFKK